jgi:glucosamine kinase
MHSDLTFCVDGGGSKSRARLVEASGRTLAEAEEGPCNPSTGLARAVESVTNLWRRCAAAAGHDPAASGDVTLAIGAAGLYVKSAREKFLAALPRFGRTVTMSDGYAALIGAGGGKPCGLMIIGTGIAGHRLWADGTSVQRDAWGWIAGDRGSGAWLGRKALRHMFSVVDGVRPRDGLSDRVLAALGGRPGLAEGMVGMGPDRLAALAPHVIAAAEAGVPRAIEIRDHAIQHLADLAGVLDIGPGDALYAFGGLAAIFAPVVAKKIAHPVALPAADAMVGSFLVATGKAPPERIRDAAATEPAQ